MTDTLKTNRDIAFLSREEINAYQSVQLQNHLRYCQENSPYYKKLFAEHNVNTGSVSLETLSDLPLTLKSDLESHNDDFYAVASEKIVDIVLSSGTTGMPTRIMYTESDLERLAYNEEVSLAGCGITNSDTALLTCTLDRCFIAGLAYFSGLRKIGVAVIRNGQNTLDSHSGIISQLNPTVIVGVPSFLKKLGRFLVEKGMEKSLAKVQKLVCIGEPLRDKNLNSLKIAADLKSIWPAQLFSTYASSESITSFCECPEEEGGHLLPDLAIAEIVDENGNVLPGGETGELVVTPMGITGMPLIRFKTGDISFLIDSPCKCGKNSARLGPILGRKAQMLKIRGTTLYPQAVFSTLEEIEEVEEFYVSANTEGELSDILSVHVATNTNAITAENIENRLQARLRVKPQVIIESIDTVRHKVFNPNFRKPIRFFDNRN